VNYVQVFVFISVKEILDCRGCVGRGCAGFVPLLLTEDVTMTGYIPLAGRSSTLVYVPASSNKVSYQFSYLALFYYLVGIDMYFEFDSLACNYLLVFIGWGV
jgi:hypothetical protein